MADQALDSFRAKVDDGMETARRTARQSFDGMKTSINTANPKVGAVVEKVEESVSKTAADFEKKGFWTNYKDFNIELFRPFQRSDGSKPLLSEIMGTVTLKPEDPKFAFIMWNVLCFWLGVVDFLVLFLFSTSLVAGALTIAACDGFAGYCFAYFFYFVFICSESKKWMLMGFIALAGYACLTLILAYNAAMTINVAEVILNVLKFVFNSIISYHAYLLFKAAPEPTEML